MSICIIDLSVFNYVCAGLHKTAFNREGNEFFSGTVHNYFKTKDPYDESIRLVKAWARLYELSLRVAYNGRAGEQFLQEAIQSKLIKTDAIQLLKYIHCIHVNIDLDTIACKETYGGEPVANVPDLTEQDLFDYKLLDNWFSELQFSIIRQLPEWDKARYSDEWKEDSTTGHEPIKLPGAIHPLWDNYTDTQKKYYAEASNKALEIAKRISDEVKAIEPPTKEIYYRQYIFECVGQIISEAV